MLQRRQADHECPNQVVVCYSNDHRGAHTDVCRGGGGQAVLRKMPYSVMNGVSRCVWSCVKLAGQKPMLSANCSCISPASEPSKIG